MIDPSLAAAVGRVADRANDVLHAYTAGFEPLRNDVASAKPATMTDLHPLSCAAPDGTYFVVLHDRKSAFTRDGALRLEHGALVSSQGLPVLGYSTRSNGGQLSPLAVDSVDAALRRPRDPRIDTDGTVHFTESTLDPRTGQRAERRVVLGRIALGRFPAGTAPVRLDDHHVAPPANVAADVGLPGSLSFPPLRLHALVLGHVDIEAGLRRLQEAYVSLEALQAAYRSRADLDKGAMDLLK